MLITFEGIDGSGKTTQMEMLRQHLIAVHPTQKVLSTREPGFYPDDLSGIYRHLICEGNTSPEQKLFLLLADRTNHYERLVGPALSHDDIYRRTPPIILCDRGADSLLAYQGYGMKLASIAFLTEANRIARFGLVPDLTIVFDLDVEVASNRVSDKLYFESLGKEFYKRVRAGYLEIAKYEPDRVVVISSTAVDETHTKVIQVVRSRLGL